MGWHPSLDCVSASSINLVDSYVQQVLPQIEGGVRRGDGDEGVRAAEGLNAKITTVSISPHPSFEKQPSNLAGVRPGGCHAAGATLPRRVSFLNQSDTQNGSSGDATGGQDLLERNETPIQEQRMLAPQCHSGLVRFIRCAQRSQAPRQQPLH